MKRRKPSLEDATAALAAGLNEIRVPWMVIGGAAVLAHGVLRTTEDVDAVMQVDAERLKPVLAALRKRKIVPRTPDAMDFARQSRVLLLVHSPTGVPIDLSLTNLDFEIEALGHARVSVVKRQRVKFATAEALLVYKLIAGRPQDLRDVQMLLGTRGLDVDYVRRRLQDLCSALEDDLPLRSLDSLLKQHGRS